MAHALDIASYFLSKDPDQNIFKNVEVRLNLYLHIAQNIYVAKTKRLLFDDPMYAEKTGALIIKVQEECTCLYANDASLNLPLNMCLFLDKIYEVLKNAPLDALIEICQEDPEWIKKHQYNKKEERKMNPISMITEYRDRYKDVIKIMNKLEIY